ncbi:MAG: EAL domain-containing protein, partial [Betaproteobacteria bacterium]|nr:EAL domain-containing protein [Betaproteobacteria bacterium]
SADASTIAEIMSAADVACYAAKDAGRNRVHAYRPGDNALRQRHSEMRWVSRLQRAMEQNQFRLFCQPVVAVAQEGGPVEYYEILLRLQDDSGGLIPPVAFVPAAERYNLMPQIDRWVVHATLNALRSGNCGDECKFAVNISGQSLCDDRFLNFVIDEFKSSGVAPSRVCFEIGEAAVMSNTDQIMRMITALHDLGCSFVLDNFGSSLNSFTFLKELKLDYLKLSRALVKDIAHDAFGRSMVEATNHIAHAGGIRTIAEFVENYNAVAALQRIGIDYIQGNEIANPRPVEEALTCGISRATAPRHGTI